MKKATLIISAIAIVFSANAQKKSNPIETAKLISNPTLQVNPSNKLKAAGDTVCYWDGYYFYGTGISGTTLTLANDDLDGLTVAANITAGFGPTSSFKFFYDLNSVTSDSIFFAGATSWFSPTAQADNWLAFGPISIPAAGATLTWKNNMPDEDFRDGYSVLVSTTGVDNVNDFTNAPIFTVTDNDPSTIADTVNTPDIILNSKTASIASYAGQDIYIAFHHTGNDQFILYLNDLLIVEGGSTNVAEFVNGVRVFQNMPNPFAKVTAINYELENAANVSLNVYDVTGKKVAAVNEGNQTAGKHIVKFNAESLSAGVYYYSLKVGENTTSAKKMVIAK